jgi:8-oxo-dGTP diphosphatase
MPKGLFEHFPKGALPILKEIMRHVLRRPLVGVAVVARRSDGQILLVRRGDTGTWALPGGTLEWGEPARLTLSRELDEEAGARLRAAGRLVGVFTAPERDSRCHGVTILVEGRVEDHITGPKNPLEILEARFFAVDALPGPLAFTMDDMVSAALSGAPPYWE